MSSTQLAPIAPGEAEWSVWTTTARVVTTDGSAVETARRVVEDELAAVDCAASRFRSDSELMGVFAAGGRPVRVSPLLAELVSVALRAAADTDGAVDPTLGSQLALLGYDRYVARTGVVRSVALKATAPAAPAAVTVHHRPSWRDVRLDGDTLTVPRGVVLDLGATAKAWAADRCAVAVVRRLGGGALVSLGGDIAVAGTDPTLGWTILVQDGPREPASRSTWRQPGAPRPSYAGAKVSSCSESTTPPPALCARTVRSSG